MVLVPGLQAGVPALAHRDQTMGRVPVQTRLAGALDRVPILQVTALDLAVRTVTSVIGRTAMRARSTVKRPRPLLPLPPVQGKALEVGRALTVRRAHLSTSRTRRRSRPLPQRRLVDTRRFHL